jgi:hypothetical protein
LGPRFIQVQGAPAPDLQNGFCPSDNRVVSSEPPTAARHFEGTPFRPGTMVVATLGNPREKFWGAVLALTPEGLSLCGIELASFEDLVSIIKDGEPFTPSVVFFPMHRLERVELDLPDGGIPSLSQRFTSKTGLDPVETLTQRGGPGENHS